MVARGAGTARPVLLACRQWDPHGLGQRLLSCGVGAWRCAPLLSWQVQCPVGVCAALAAGKEGQAHTASCRPATPPCCPSLASLAVLVAGCPVRVSSLSLAGTPFQVVSAFCGLGPVALLVRTACQLRGRVLALLLCSRPPPSCCLFERAAREVPSQGAGRAVRNGSCPSTFFA